MTQGPQSALAPADSPWLSRLQWGAWALFFVLFALLSLVFLDVGNLWNSDDAIYGYVVHQVVHRGDWSLSWLGDGVARYYPLGMWWMALVASVAGTDEAGLRLSSALAALLGVALWGLWRDPRRGALEQPWLYAAALLAVQPMFFTLSQRVMHDCLLSALIIAGLGMHLRAARVDRGGPWSLGAGLLCGLASLVKFGAGLLPLAVLGLHLLLHRRREWKNPWLWGELALGALTPVLFLLWRGELGSTIEAILGRFAGLEGHASQDQPSLNVLDAILAQGAPGVLLLALALVGGVLAARRRSAQDSLALLWTGVAAAVLLVMQTRLPHYKLQLILPLCALAGVALARWVAWLRASRREAVALLLPLLLGGALFWTVENYRGVHSNHHGVAAMSRLMAQASPDTYLCTLDVYHVLPVYMTGRPVEYLTEDEYSRRVLRRTFGEETVPTLDHAGVVARLQGRGFVCLAARVRVPLYLEELGGGVEVLPSQEDPSLVLLRRQ